MASSIQFSGLASGLDTTSIISQLMSVEAAPQNALKTRLGTEQSKLTAMQSLNSGIQALATSARSFATGSTWTSLTATSSDSNVTVAADNTATAANFSVKVNRTASAATLSFADAHALTDVVADPSTSLTLKLQDGTLKTIDTGDGTLKTILKNLNALKDNSGQPYVSASAVNNGDGTVRVLLTANATGAGTLDLTGPGLDLGATNPVAGRDAEIVIGDDIVVSSKSNTFTAVMPGVNITLGANASATTKSQVAVVADASSRSTGVKAMISQLNSVLTSLTQATSYGTTPTTAGATAPPDSGILAGDTLIRGFATQLLGTVYTSSGGVTNDLGISIDRYGQFQFDATQFAAAYAKDPVAVQDAIAGPNGFASRIVTVANQISGTAGLQSDNTILKSDGQLTQIIKQQQGTISDYNKQITAWDDRLAQKQASLQLIYTNLETTLSKLSAQQSWLTSQIEALSSDNN